jgi:hypothetical protein
MINVHVEICVYAADSTSHRSELAVHKRPGAIDLQLRYDPIGLEV